MANQCEICKKKSMMGRQYKKLMSKYNPTPKKRKYPNLQKLTLPNGKKVLACTKCIKALSKTGV
ncbi:MAG: L28 family ribosomal protein [Candidatus Pacebacteria bacterium]|nr:L28 family ribosomal protein [Candidatus Paceibacterota bacterium]